MRAKSYPVATDEIQGAKSTTLIPDNTEMEHAAMLYVSNRFCLCLWRKVKNNNIEKTKDMQTCIYIIYHLHNLEFEFNLWSGRNIFLCVRLVDLGGILLSLTV